MNVYLTPSWISAAKSLGSAFGITFNPFGELLFKAIGSLRAYFSVWSAECAIVKLRFDAAHGGGKAMFAIVASIAAFGIAALLDRDLRDLLSSEVALPLP